MSAPLFADDILFFQRLLRADGLYTAKLDGKWGPKTEKAAKAFEEASAEIRLATGSFDTRSEANLATLALPVQQLARSFLNRVLESGMLVRIISGTRTYAEQDALFRKGRFGNPGPRVTNARGGQSNHNFGIAWDIGVFTTTGGYVTEGPPYKRAAKLGRAGQEDAIEWGGDWTSFVDLPHFQWALDVPIDEWRPRFEAGTWRWPT